MKKTQNCGMDNEKTWIRLETLRRAHNLTQEELCRDYLFISDDKYRSWRNNAGNIDISSVKTLCLLYNVSSDFLIVRTDWTHVENEQISELTGLSDESIEVLRAINAKNTSSDETIKRGSNLEKGTLDFINFILEKAYNEHFPLNKDSDKELIYTLFATMNEYINSENATVYYKKKDGKGLWTDYSNDIAFSIPDGTGAFRGECLLTNGNELYSEAKLRTITNTLYEYRKGGTNNG